MTNDIEGTKRTTINPERPLGLADARPFLPLTPGRGSIFGTHWQLPGYTITEVLAQNPRRSLFAAREHILERDVTVKTLGPSGTPAEFLAEAFITARLPHPNIPPVYALGRFADDTPYLVLKTMRGRTLAEELKARVGVASDLARFIHIFEQLAHAVGFAHAQGIVHRGLEPAAVMVGTFGEVQVLDWGLAGNTATTPADVGMLAPGTTWPAYIAPEQASGKVVDARGDVFALGGILTTILTGNAVFSGASPHDLLAAAAHGDTTPALVQLQACGADVELIQLAQACLAADPADRPADGRVVAATVAHYRQTVAERLRQAESERCAALALQVEQRKQRRLIQIAVACCLGMLLVGAGGTMLARQNAQQKKLLAQEREREARAEASAKEQARQAAATQAESELLAKEDADRQRQDAEAALVLASQRTQLALDTFKQMVFSVQEKLQHRAATNDLRKDLLTNARNGLQQLIADAKQLDRPDLTLAWSHFQIGEIQVSLGNTTAAERELRAGYELTRKLALANPRDVMAQRGRIQGARRLANVHFLLGNTKESLAYATEAYEAGRQRRTDQGPDVLLDGELCIVTNTLGEIALRLNQTNEAAAYFRDAFALAEKLQQPHEVNLDVARLLVTCQSNLGRIAHDLGQSKEAYRHYEIAFQRCKKLAKSEPQNTTLQRDWCSCADRLGDIARQLGQTATAFKYSQEALEARQALADADPADMHGQRDLAVSYDIIGDMASTQRLYNEALQLHQKANLIYERLAKDSTDNIVMQRDRALNYVRLGDCKRALGLTSQAVASYNQAAAIGKQMAANDPKNVLVQRDVILFCDKLGDVMRQLGLGQQALEYYQNSMTARQHMVNENPMNIMMQRDLSIGHEKLGDVAVRFATPSEALPHYQKALVICERLVEHDANDIQAQVDLFICLFKNAKAVRLSGDFTKATATYKKARQVAAPLVQARRLPPRQQVLLELLESEMLVCEHAPAAIADIEAAFKLADKDLMGEVLDVRVRTLVQNKKPADALATAERYAAFADDAKTGDRNDYLLRAASLYALCAVADPKNDTLVPKIIGYLAKLQERQYFSPPQFAYFMQERHFQQLLTRTPFQTFITQLEEHIAKKYQLPKRP